MYSLYMYILSYVKVIWYNDIPRSIVNWSWEEMYPQYMCILLYVKPIWCNDNP